MLRLMTTHFYVSPQKVGIENETNINQPLQKYVDRVRAFAHKSVGGVAMRTSHGQRPIGPSVK